MSVVPACRRVVRNKHDMLYVTEVMFFVAHASVVPVSVCGRSSEEIRNSLVAFLHCPLAVKPFELDFQLRLEISDTQIVFS